MQYSTMERLMSLLLLYSVLFGTGGLVLVVNAQVFVFTEITTPEAGRKEGGQVEMRCVATNLQSDHIVQWRTRDPYRALTWGDDVVITDPRYDIDITHVSNTEIMQDITISDLQRNDTNEYICYVTAPTQVGGNKTVAVSVVMLTVLYFPDESFPMCFPDGPITADTGTELNLRCTSESGNPQVRMEISQIPMTSNPYTWSELMDGGNAVWRAMTLTVDESHNNVTFQCTISSNSNPETHYCSIGPFKVRDDTDSSTGLAMWNPSITPPSASNAGLIAGASAGGVAVLVCILILILLYRRGRAYKNESHESRNDLELNRTDQGFPIPPQRDSQPNIYGSKTPGLDGNLQASEMSRVRSNHTVTEHLTPEPAASHSNAGEAGTAEDHCPPVYTKPHATRNNENNDKARSWKTDLADAAEQSYDNPVFESKDRDDITRGERPIPPSKPLAMVPPMTRVPKKPAPYKPKAERSSEPAYQPPPQQRGHRQESAGRSTSTPAPADLQDADHAESQDDGYTGSREANPASHQVPTYAQVTRHSSDTVSDPASENRLLYADLDLSDPLHDKAAPQSDQTVYASVTHM